MSLEDGGANPNGEGGGIPTTNPEPTGLGIGGNEPVKDSLINQVEEPKADNGGTPPNATGGEPNKADTPTKPMSDDEWLDAIKMPEDAPKTEDGKTLEVDKDFIKAFMPVFRKAGLTPEVVSEIAGIYAKAGFERSQATAKEQAQEREKFGQYASEMRAKSQKELSSEDLTYANRAMNEIKKRDSDFYNGVRNSILGVHPEFLKLCAMAGRRIADDGLPKPNNMGGGAQRTRAERLYGDMIANGEMNP